MPGEFRFRHSGESVDDVLEGMQACQSQFSVVAGRPHERHPNQIGQVKYEVVTATVWKISIFSENRQF